MTAPNFTQWQKELDQICITELGISLYDLPDVPMMDDFQDGTTPEDAFQNYCADRWEVYDPERRNDFLSDFLDL